MKALTLTQPWATLVAAGEKRVETRSWGTNYRGALAIHAAKGFPRDAIELCFEQPFAAALRRAGVIRPSDLPRGVVLATVDLVDCRHTTPDLLSGDWIMRLSDNEEAFGDFSTGRFGWFLENVRCLPNPVPARGSLGLWDWQR